MTAITTELLDFFHSVRFLQNDPDVKLPHPFTVYVSGAYKHEFVLPIQTIAVPQEGKVYELKCADKVYVRFTNDEVLEARVEGKLVRITEALSISGKDAIELTVARAREGKKVGMKTEAVKEKVKEKPKVVKADKAKAEAKPKVEKKKRCPKGKVRNPVTGRCGKK